MSDFVKGALKKLMQEHGESLCSEISRLKGLLSDACPSCRKEVHVLLSAAHEGLITEIKKGVSEAYREADAQLSRLKEGIKAGQGINERQAFLQEAVRLLTGLKKGGISEVYIRSFPSRLQNATGVDEALADWSIRAWSEALGSLRFNVLMVKLISFSFCHLGEVGQIVRDIEEHAKQEYCEPHIFMIRAAINGYGRIGRVAHRVIMLWHNDEIDVVAINAGSSTDLKGWMYLLKYDSAYGVLPDEVSVKPNTDPNKLDLLGFLLISNREIPVYSQIDPSKLPWKDLGVDVVIEATGACTEADKLQMHIDAGAKSVVLAGPTKGGGVPTYVISVNDEQYTGEKIISNASCTTNCIAPVSQIIQANFGIDRAMMTTIHSFTSDQSLQDGGHGDYRHSRAASLNIVPTSTEATIATAEAVPALSGIFAGLAIRVPVVVGSLADFTFLLKRPATKGAINDALKTAAQKGTYKGILSVTEEPLVSSDIIGNSHSSIVDLSLTQVVGGNMAKIIAWYDNEYGYANRLVEQVIMVGQRSRVLPSQRQ